MIKFGRIFLIVLLFLLVGAALNTSNGAINQLTAQNHEAVIGADYNNDVVSIYLLGQSYDYSMDKLRGAVNYIELKTYQVVEKVVQHFIKCYRIFRAVFLL